LILESVAQGKEIIYVTVNYRVSGFGFMPGKAILEDGSSNLGLLDQRLGLQWVADNISQFGGDPSKATLWGESAGSVSVFDQMAIYNGDNTYNGKPIFRGAMMDSGSIIPSDPIDCAKGEAV
jgi:carboxylesterase type B